MVKFQYGGLVGERCQMCTKKADTTQRMKSRQKLVLSRASVRAPSVIQEMTPKIGSELMSRIRTKHGVRNKGRV